MSGFSDLDDESREILGILFKPLLQPVDSESIDEIVSKKPWWFGQLKPSFEELISEEKKLELNSIYLKKIELLESVLVKLVKTDVLLEVQKIKEHYLLTGQLTKIDMANMNKWYTEYYLDLINHPDAVNIFVDISNKLNPKKDKP